MQPRGKTSGIRVYAPGKCRYLAHRSADSDNGRTEKFIRKKQVKTTMAQEKNIVLSAENLSIGYKDSGILRSGISVSLARGSLSCLIGRNGAGKSTLLRTMCGFQSPLSGTVTLNGKPADSYSRKELSRKMSVVLTEMLGEINYLTVRQTVETGRYPYCDCFATLGQEDRTAVNRAMKTAGVEHLAGRTMAEISDGQRQKVMIAKALAQDTDVILLDEPLSFLDMPAKVEIMNILKNLAQAEGKSLVLSTHDIDLALHFADSLWVMRSDGAVRQENRPWADKNAIVDDVFGVKGELIKDFLKL
ncbi:MAG: ABC transporter ATP-binding protein [Flavobacteriales bacterium]|nr:MAG: ABC transporter ATP-binding protein [Flavobacteriales bacterium]